MTRNGASIVDHHLKGGVNPGIKYAMGFAEWDSAIAAGATLTELERWDAGGFSKAFMAKVITWQKLKALIHAHTEDAKATKAAQSNK